MSECYDFLICWMLVSSFFSIPLCLGTQSKVAFPLQSVLSHSYMRVNRVVELFSLKSPWCSSLLLFLLLWAEKCRLRSRSDLESLLFLPNFRYKSYEMLCEWFPLFLGRYDSFQLLRRAYAMSQSVFVDLVVWDKWIFRKISSSPSV